MVCLSRSPWSRMSCIMWHLRQVAATGQKPGPTWARRSHPCLCLGSRSQEDLQVSRSCTALFLLTFSFHRDLVDFDTHLDDLSMVVFQLNVMFIKKFLLFSGLSQCWTEHGDWLLSLMTCAAAFKTCLVIITFIVQKCPSENFVCHRPHHVFCDNSVLGSSVHFWLACRQARFWWFLPFFMGGKI